MSVPTARSSFSGATTATSSGEKAPSISETLDWARALLALNASELNEDMDALLGQRPQMKLRIWNVHGRLSEFKQDLIAR